MNILPFGQTVLLWRLERGLSQGELARNARMPRPNLSAVERGRREVSLTTARALARALGTSAGTLVDGIPPKSADARSKPWSREALERVAEAVVRGRRLSDPAEDDLARILEELTRNRQEALQRRAGRIRGDKRAVRAAWMRLESAYPKEVVHSILQRIEDKRHAR